MRWYIARAGAWRGWGERVSEIIRGRSEESGEVAYTKRVPAELCWGYIPVERTPPVARTLTPGGETMPECDPMNADMRLSSVYFSTILLLHVCLRDTHCLIHISSHIFVVQHGKNTPNRGDVGMALENTLVHRHSLPSTVGTSTYRYAQDTLIFTRYKNRYYERTLIILYS